MSQSQQAAFFEMKGEIAVPTEAGLEFLKRIATDPTGQVYAFTNEADPLMVAGALARLSRTGDDARMVILKEFAGKEGKVLEDFFDRVVTSYGDDSVQQLMPIMLVVERCSNLMTKPVERGRPGDAFLEQSTRYIFFDKKVLNERGEPVYRYYIPENFSQGLLARYRSDMDLIFNLYSLVVKRLTEFVRQKTPFATDATDEKTVKEHHAAWLGATRAQACDAARTMLPVATTSTVGIVGSAQAIDTLIMRLAGHDLPEANELAKRLLREVRKVAGAFFKRTDMPNRGGAIINYKKEIRQRVQEQSTAILGDHRLLPQETQHVQVNLVDYWPKDELEVVRDLLWSGSNASYGSIGGRWEGFREEDLIRVLEAGIGDRLNRRHRPGRSFEFAHFKWENVCDYGIFRDLQRHRMVDGLDWQDLTPFMGYDVPPIVVEAGLEKEFHGAFTVSEALYRALRASGFDLEAQYATLLGHRMRWRIMMNVRQSFHFHEIRTIPEGHSGYRKVTQMMHEKFGEVYPRIAKAMKFVNLGEDPELTRLAGERATQAKLGLLQG